MISIFFEQPRQSGAQQGNEMSRDSRFVVDQIIALALTPVINTCSFSFKKSFGNYRYLAARGVGDI